MPLWQYQQKAEPLPVITVDKWIPVFPNIVTRQRSSVPRTGISVLPPADIPVVPLIAKWEPVYPSVLLRNRPRDYNNYSITLPLAPQKVFVGSWLPTYPNSFYDKKRIISLNAAFVSLVTVTPVTTSISWVAQYPIIIRSRVNRTALYTNAFFAPILVSPRDITNYYRRYLNDPLTQPITGPAVTFTSATPTALTAYFRRYLNDPFAESIYMWILPSNLADGFTSQFIFTSRPVWCSFNGLNQFETEGYTLQLIGSTFGVTFIDVNGNIIVPEIGADIRAEIN